MEKNTTNILVYYIKFPLCIIKVTLLHKITVSWNFLVSRLWKVDPFHANVLGFLTFSDGIEMEHPRELIYICKSLIENVATLF